MSHTTTVSDILFVSVSAIKGAVRELKKQGINCDLLENTVPRAYSPHQAGMSEPAPFVVQLHDARYDVGLYPVQDGNGYEARTDLYMNSVGNVLGVHAPEGTPPARAAMGKLYHAYAVQAVQEQAAMEGFTISASQTDENGNTVLQLVA